jgi:uncharacterized protein YjdB
MRQTGKRLLSVILSLVFVAGLLVATPLTSRAAQAENIISYARGKLGSTAYYYLCQAFVRECYENGAGIYASSNALSAYQAWSWWGRSTSRDNIPVGACVYFLGGVYDGTYGHVGIYIGDGRMIDAVSTVRETSINWNGYLGWGYQAGVEPTRNPSTPTPSKPTVTPQKSEFPLNEYVVVNWNRCSNASWYDITVKNMDTNTVIYTRDASNTNGDTTFISEKFGLGSYAIIVTAVNYTDKIQATASDWKYFKVVPPNYTTSVANGTYVIQAKNGGLVDVSGTPINSGNVTIYDALEPFTFERQSDNTYIITSVYGNKCALEVAAFSKSEGGNVQVYTYGGQESAKWYLVDCGNGYYKFVNKYSGYVLDVLNNGNANGTNIQQWRDNGTDAQRFKLICQHATRLWATTTPATCTTAGKQEYKCQSCGNVSETRTVAALGHNYGFWLVTKAATCTAAGTEMRTCQNDSTHKETRPIPAKDHSWSAWKTTKAATANATGTQERTCSVCKAKENKTLAKLPPVLATKITLNSTAAVTLGVGQTVTRTATVAPSNTTNKTVTWTSSNTKVATVSSGKVTAKGAGTATITAKTSNGKTASFKVTVKPAPTKIILNKAVTLGVGEKYQSNVTLTPSNALNKRTYSSSNTKVATVDSSGKITTKAVGTAKITVKTYNGKTSTITVTVKKAPTKVTLNKTTLSLTKGKTVTLTASIPSGTACLTAKTWTSSNKAVATVNKNGKITAVKKGTATITVKLYNGKTATCKATVK